MSAIDRVNRTVSSLQPASSDVTTDTITPSNYIVATAGAADHLTGTKITVPNDIVSINDLELNGQYEKITQLNLDFVEALYNMHNLRQLHLVGTTMRSANNIRFLTAPALNDSISGGYYNCLTWLIRNHKLVHITMPDIYTEVAEYSFSVAAYNLLSFSAPKCTTIGAHGFDQCSRLFNLNVPFCKTIESHALSNTPVSSITMPFNTTVISDAFANCYGLSTIHLIWPDSESIGSMTIYLSNILNGISDTTQITYVDIKMVDGSDIGDDRELIIYETKDGRVTLTNANPSWTASS